MKRTLFSIAILSLLISTAVRADKYMTPEQQKAAEKKYDKLGILHDAAMKSDTSPQFLMVPEDYPEIRDFSVAKEAPTVDFAIIQGMEPFVLPVLHPYHEGGIYGGWGDVSKGPDGCFYYSIGDHRGCGGTAYMFRYDPADKTNTIVIDLKKVVGYGDDVFGDGKFHGDPEVSPDGDMWLLSYFGPAPLEEDFETWHGSWLFHHNVFSGKTECVGIALEGESWPYHAWDWDRNLLFGVGSLNKQVVVYDTNERCMLYGGVPPDGITWFERGVMLDRDTGIIYTTDTIKYADGERLSGRYRGEQRMVSYERRNNRFTRLQSLVPPNKVTGTVTPLRAHTKVKDSEGAFWCCDVSGAMFRFFPAEDRIEQLGMNWGKEGKYLANMCFSPKKRYIYYLPGADTHAHTYGTPVVQYDTKTHKKKVIAFLNDFYLEKYGYCPGGTYGVELDEAGESLFFYMNGQFTTKELGTGYGRPAIFHVHIPESERVE